MEAKLKINVIGLGYIGLPTALALAEGNHTLVGTDLNKNLIKSLNTKKINFPEPGLNELFFKAIKKDIIFKENLVESDVYIITVPTPHNHDTKEINLHHIFQVLQSLKNLLKNKSLIIIESTISPGTIENKLVPFMLELGLKDSIDYVISHAPERILPGNLIHELYNNSRTIGVNDSSQIEKITSIYSSFSKGELIFTDIKTAELSKIIENTYRDINIAFANELLLIANELEIDVYKAIEIANKHPRVNILKPGPGVGGHCISVDPWFLVGEHPKLTKLIRTARDVNDFMPKYVLNKIKKIIKDRDLKSNTKIGIYGLSYKENVDDFRESPTLQLIEKIDKKALENFYFYDPLIKPIITDNQMDNIYDFVNQSDIIVIMVNHKDLADHLKLFINKIVLDTKKVYPEADYVL